MRNVESRRSQMALGVAAFIGLLLAIDARVDGGAPKAPTRPSQPVMQPDLTSLFRSAEQGLRRHFPDWRVMPRGDFEPNVVSHVRTMCRAEEGPERCAGDFDGNGLMDAAFVIRKGDRVLYLALNQQRGGLWEPHVLAGETYRNGFQGGHTGFQVFLLRRGPGHIDYWDGCGRGKSGRINLKYPGIEIVFFEKAADLHYWVGSHYVSVQTAD